MSEEITIVTMEQLVALLEDPIQRPQVIESLRYSQPDIARRLEENPEQVIAEIREGPIAKYGLTPEEKEAVKRVEQLITCSSWPWVFMPYKLCRSTWPVARAKLMPKPS